MSVRKIKLCYDDGTTYYLTGKKANECETFFRECLSSLPKKQQFKWKKTRELSVEERSMKKMTKKLQELKQNLLEVKKFYESIEN